MWSGGTGRWRTGTCRVWGQMLTDLGFKVRMVRVPDVLPYPHVVIAATRVD